MKALRAKKLLIGCGILLVVLVCSWFVSGRGPRGERIDLVDGIQTRTIIGRASREMLSAHARSNHPRLIRLHIPPAALKARRAQALAHVVGISHLDLKRVRDGVILPLSVKVDETCRGGDLDALMQDMQPGEKDGVLLTIEPLGKSDAFKPIVKHVSAAELQSGFDASIKVPRTRGVIQAGIFICRDATGTGRCRNKPAAAIDAILAGHQGPKSDKNYYFQYLLIEPGQATVLDNTRMNARQYKRLKTYLRVRGAADGDAVDQARALNNALGSLPLTLQNHEMQISMPRMDPQCKLQSFVRK